MCGVWSATHIQMWHWRDLLPYEIRGPEVGQSSSLFSFSCRCCCVGGGSCGSVTKKSCCSSASFNILYSIEVSLPSSFALIICGVFSIDNSHNHHHYNRFTSPLLLSCCAYVLFWSWWIIVFLSLFPFYRGGNFAHLFFFFFFSATRVSYLTSRANHCAIIIVVRFFLHCIGVEEKLKNIERKRVIRNCSAKESSELVCCT